MTWFKVDDSFYDHPKVYDSSDAAVALWTRAGSWSARNLTDGFVPSGMLARLSSDGETAAAELCDRRLWRRTRGGFRFHDWAVYQPSRERVEREREQAKIRQAKYRAGKGSKTRKPRSGSETSRRDSQRDSRITEGVTNGVSHTTPTRPSSSYEEERVGDRPALRTGAAGPDPSRASPPYGDEDPRIIAADQQRLIDLAADRERELAEEAERAVLGGQLVRDELARRRAEGRRLA